MERIKRPIARLINVVYRLIDEHSETENYEYFRSHRDQAIAKGDTVLLLSSLYALGYLCQRMSLYSYASKYYKEALNAAANADTDDRDSVELLRQWILIETVFLECDQNNLSEAHALLREIDQGEDLEGKELDHRMALLYTSIYVRENDLMRVKKGTDVLLKLYHEYAMPLRDYVEYSELAVFLIEKNEREIADRILTALHEFSAASEKDEIRRVFLKNQLLYELGEKDSMAWNDTFFEFENLSVKKEKEALRIKRNALNSKEMNLKQKEANNIRQRIESLKKIGSDEAEDKSDRTRINEEGQRLFEKANASGEALGVILMDIKEFMKYNQKYGVEAGNVCITAVEDILKSEPSSTFATRYGGDEFIAMFLNRNTEELISYTRQISRKLKEFSVELSNGNNIAGVSLCYGIVNQEVTGGHTWSDFIHTADYALYKAKSEDCGYLVQSINA